MSNPGECSEPGIALCLEQGFAKSHRGGYPTFTVSNGPQSGWQSLQPASVKLQTPQIPDPPLEVLGAHTPKSSSGSEKILLPQKLMMVNIKRKKERSL